MKLMESSLVLLNCVGIAWSSGVLKEIRLLNKGMNTVKTATYIVATLVCALWTVPATAEDRPNIIVMMVDDMGFSGPSIAPYGNPHYKTPGMDRLASEGLLFTDFHASGAICSATRAGLMTGRYQQRAGIEAVIHPHAIHPEHRKGLHEDEVTFAELFKDAGYSTGLVGKWHLGYAAETPKYHPMNHGFDYFMGYVSGNIDYINHWGDHMQHDWWHGRKETKEEGYTTHLINKYALEFIEQNKDKPFCLYIAHESPHSPVQGPDDPIQRGPGAKQRSTPHAEAMKQMILEMDKGVEQVRAKLVELGLEKNTLFLFFSDNGDAPGTATGSPRFRGHKGSVYEGGTRVPAVAWWPGRIEAGTQAADLSITLDVMPTILSVAGIDPPKERSLDGIDLSPVLFEQKALPARPLFWADLSNNGSRSEALRDGPWKLVVQHPKAKPGTFENDAIELFNLTNDEGEETNLAARQPERAAEMLERIKAWYADTQGTASPQPGGWLRTTRDARDGGMRELLAASIYASPNVDIAVPNGPYTLQLLLYEGWRSRSADIVIEGKTVRAAYDMFKEQGGNFDHGSVLRHTFTLTDGNIDIEIKGPLHLGGLILSKGKADSADRVAIVKSQADLDLKDVIKAINFGDTKGLNIGDVKFAAAAVNTTFDSVTNTARGDVYAGEYQQNLPQIQYEKTPNVANAKGKPNILFICTDDQAPWAMGASGNRQAVTPHMDALAAQSAYLHNAFVTTPVCSPSRAATLTGRYGYEVGVFNWFKPGDQQNGLDLDETTFAEALRTAGYRTGLIGKWHLGMNDRYYPTRQGFDYFMGHRHGGFATVNPDLEEQDEKKKYKGLTADVLGDHVVKFLTKHVADHADEPFLLCWHTRAPHTRWLPVAPEDMKPYAGDAKIDIPTYPDLDEDRVNPDDA
jgi:arylsulfatase A